MLFFRQSGIGKKEFIFIFVLKIMSEPLFIVAFIAYKSTNQIQTLKILHSVFLGFVF